MFPNGKCVNCDTPISTSILCPKCTPQEPVRYISTREVKISEMEIGETGYTEEYAIFIGDGTLFVIGSARITPQYGGYKTVKITRRDDIFEIDSHTIAGSDIWDGWPTLSEETDYLWAKLV